MTPDFLPRIRARVATYAEPKNLEGQFCFEISIWTFDGRHCVGEPIVVGPFKTEEIAHDEMQKSVKMVCDEFAERNGLPPSDEYLDMKNGGVLRPWVDHS